MIDPATVPDGCIELSGIISSIKYPVISDPPLFSGGVQKSVIDVPPTVKDDIVGGFGIDAIPISTYLKYFTWLSSELRKSIQRLTI